ncbi:MAG: HAD-IA family hydrolase [Bacteroidales bacterium]|nr:HAD-IA family hydrolase [Bacteroidales bacterium]
MKKLVILDFDGTLADTRELIIRTSEEAMRRMGYPVQDEETIAATIGLILEEGLLQMYPDLPRETLPVWVKTYREIFEELRLQIVPAVFPQVRETLAALSGKGVTFSVASSRKSNSLHDFLESMGLSQYISYVLGADDVTRAKPHPEPVLKTLQELGVPATEAMVVGDMPVDIQMGLGAGAWTCGVTYGNSNREALFAAGAHHVIDRFGELLSLI